MKKTLRTVLGSICSVALLLSTLVFPASASTVETTETIDSWAFYSDEHAGNTSNLFIGNEADTIEINDNDYEKTAKATLKSINNGVYTANHTTTSNRGYSVVSFKLANRLTVGQTYKFEVGFYSDGNTWVENLALACYGGAMGGAWSDNQWTTDVWPAFSGDKLLLNKGSKQIPTNTNNRVSFEFTATEALGTRDWLVFMYRVANDSSQRVATYHITNAKLETSVITERSDFDENGDTIIKDWSFAGKTFNDLDINAIQSLEWWDGQCKVTRTIENGVYSLTSTDKTQNMWNAPLRIYFKLDDDLVVGKKYKLAVNIYSPDNASTKLETSNVFYSTTIAHDQNVSVGYVSTAGVQHPLIPSSITAIGTVSQGQVTLSQSSDAVLNYQFTATAEMVKDGYIGFAAQLNNEAKGTYCVKGARLTMKNDVQTLNEDGDIQAGDWSFAGKTFNDPDINVITNANWDDTKNCNVTRTIQDGIYSLTSTDKTKNMWNAPLRIYFKLNTDLVVGKEYKLAINIYSPDDANTFLSADSKVFYSTTKDHDQNVSVGYVGSVTHTLIPSTVTPIGTVTKSSTVQLGQSADSVITYKFTATSDMVSGGYIGFAAKLANDAKGTYCIKGAKLTAPSVEKIKDYDFDFEGTRNETFKHVAKNGDATNGGSNSLAEGKITDPDTYAPSTGSLSGTLAIKKYQYQLILAIPTADLQLEENTEYIVDLKGCCAYDGGTVNFYAGVPTSFDSDANMDTDATYPALQIGNPAGNIRATMDGPLDYSYTFTTSGSSIDFDTYSQLYVVIRPNDSTNGNQTLCYTLSISKRIKGNRLNKKPVLERSRYNKIVFAENDFATYAIKKTGTDDEFTELEGNIAAMLDNDTQYTVKVKYADDGRFFESDYGEEVTFSTLKLGDTNEDGVVNLLDLVRMKKGIAAGSDDEIFDLVDDDGNNANDLTALRKIILA